ncbi:Mth938-like domain-containing protein [Aquabacterium sp.]|uniref:Mth938-like domain-containing protein n=1 Tax=Aquabacterium sp. TaxID=1872578 RepID=UPI0035AF9E07
MKLQPDRAIGVNVVNACTNEHIVINGQAWRESVLLPASGTVLPWHVTNHEDLTVEHFGRILNVSPELVIFGSGPRLRFVQPILLTALMARRIGIETMDTAAACRTFNVLAAEGRNVVAALLLQAST